jgi:hypothetical protein
MISENLENELRGAFARSAAGITIPAVAVSLAAVAGTASSGLAPGPEIRLASYTFRMPAGYRLTRAGAPRCQTSSVLEYFRVARSGDTSRYGSIRAAAASSRACVGMDLEPAYRPTAAVPDPDVPVSTLQRYGQQPRRVRVGRYHGVIFTVRLTTLGTERGGLATPELVVRLPFGHGEFRDLAVSGDGLSRAELLRIVADGLSS